MGRKVLAAIDPKPDETFLEIGPGRGALTRPLLARARAVVAFEIDRDLAASGASIARAPPNLTVVEGDFLDVGLARTPISGAGLTWPPSGAGAGNLPYNVASPILFKLAALHASGVRFADATVMLQREVADRLVAEPGTHDYGVLAVLIRHVADVQPLLMLPSGALSGRLRGSSPRSSGSAFGSAAGRAGPRVFTALVRAIFTRRRKMLANALLAFTAPAGDHRRGPGGDAGIDGRRRPETLAIPELVALADALSPSFAFQIPAQLCYPNSYVDRVL